MCDFVKYSERKFDISMRQFGTSIRIDLWSLRAMASAQRWSRIRVTDRHYWKSRLIFVDTVHVSKRLDLLVRYALCIFLSKDDTKQLELSVP